MYWEVVSSAKHRVSRGEAMGTECISWLLSVPTKEPKLKNGFNHHTVLRHVK